MSVASQYPQGVVQSNALGDLSADTSTGTVRPLFAGIHAILLAVALAAYLFGRPGLGPVPELVLVASLVVLAQVLYHRFAFGKVDWLSADMLFIFGFYVVHFGYPLLWSIGYAESDKDIWWTEQLVPRGICLAIMGLCSFCIGFNLIRVPSPSSLSLPAFDGGVLLSWRRFGLILVVPAFGVLLVFRALYYGEAGEYGEAFRIRGEFGIASVLYTFAYTFLLIGLAFCFVSGFLLGKGFISGVLPTAIWIGASLFYLVTGDRMRAGVIILLGMIAFSSFRRRIGGIWLLGMAILAGAVFGAIGVARHVAFGSVQGAYELVSQEFDPLSGYENLMGSFRTVIVAFQVRENYGLFHGASWIVAAMTILPFGGRLIPYFIAAPAFQKAYWVSQIIAPGNETNSAGTTVIADSYLDFGVYGVIGISLLVGMVAGTFRKKAMVSGSIGWAVGYVALAATFASLARFQYDDFLRVSLWPLIMTGIASAAGISSYYLLSSRSPR